jgi:parallel beta-helix repeat protein
MLLVGTVLHVSGTVIIDKTTTCNVSGNTLYVGGTGLGNYSKIQDAINDSVDGGTVYVYDDSSPYFENLIIDKSISLIGENKYTTVIDASKNNDVVRITANQVNIKEFTIQNASHYGMNIRSDYNTIIGNIITKNHRQGIRIEDGCHNIITANILINNPAIYYCICLDNSRNNQILDNEISYNGNGILIGDDSDQNRISKNIIHDNSGTGGIWLIWCENNIITGNTIYNNNNGIDCDAHYTTITGNFIYNNSQGIVLTSSTNIITENTIKNNNRGIRIWDYGKNQIFYNNFINNNRSAHVSSEHDTFWDDGEHGNYWDDYTGVDTNNDNIGDTPYEIPWGNKDNYPFMHPYPLDKESPTVEITKPLRAIYINNVMIRPCLLMMSLIIGDIDIEVNAKDDSEIHRVEFYIGGELQYVDRDEPFIYTWSKEKSRLFIHIHLIKIVAHDYAGKTTQKTILVRRFF